MIRHLLTLAVFGVLLAPQSRAGVLMTMLNPNVSAAPGSTVTFKATISNGEGYELFLNNSAVNIVGSSFTYNDLFAFLPISIGDGLSSGPVDLVEVTLSMPLLDPPGIYAGTYTLLGGPDFFTQNVLATGDFTITIGDVPEPGTWVLLASAVPVFALLNRRRRRV